jgi:hypothetical protein
VDLRVDHKRIGAAVPDVDPLVDQIVRIGGLLVDGVGELEVGDVDEWGVDEYAICGIAVTACERCVGHKPVHSITARSGTPD